jgi:hypothetical protein
LHLAQPSLEDVFLHRTGKHFLAAEAVAVPIGGRHP